MTPNTTAKTPKIHTSAIRLSLGQMASNTPKITTLAAYYHSPFTVDHPAQPEA